MTGYCQEAILYNSVGPSLCIYGEAVKPIALLQKSSLLAPEIYSSFMFASSVQILHIYRKIIINHKTFKKIIVH